MRRRVNVPQNCLKVPQVCLKVPQKCLKVPPLFSGTYFTARSKISQLRALVTGICSIQILILLRSTLLLKNVRLRIFEKTHLFEKRRQPLTPTRRQHDTADGEGLVFNLRLQAHSTKSFSKKTSCLFLLTVWTTYNIQIQLHSQLTLTNVAENIKPLGSKPECAPSCL